MIYCTSKIHFVITNICYSVNGCTPDVQQKKRVYEDLSKKHVTPLQLHGKTSTEKWKRLKPRAKPNSLIKKLLDRFESHRLRNS